MPRGANARTALSGDGEKQQKVKAASAQLYADVVFWANVYISTTGGTIAKLVDPLIRHHIREKLVLKGLDPDQLWKEYQEEQAKEKPKKLAK